MIGRFQLVRELGRGSFATVWQATDEELGRSVAVKILHDSRLTPEDVERFTLEAKAVGRLSHPGIVPVYDTGVDHQEGTVSRHYIVSQLIEGATLSEWASGEKPDARQVAVICRQVAEAVAHAHENGIVHRDLKPENILMDKEGNPFVTDFGLASISELQLTQDNITQGTVAYMSPEQACGEATEVSDVFSIGIVMFELLTGELPFRGTRILECMNSLLNDDVRPPRKYRPEIPRDLETICLKCLQKDPSDRYQSARELADDLVRFDEHRRIHARPISLVDVTRKWARRNAVRLMIALATSLLLLIALAVAFSINLSRQIQEARAEGFLRKSFGAIDEMIRVVDINRPSDLSIRDIRDQQAAVATKFLQRFVEGDHASPQARLELAVAYMYLGNIARAGYDRRQETIENFQRAVEVLEALTGDYRRESVYHRELAQSQYQLGLELELAGQPKLAAAQYERAGPNYEKALELADEERRLGSQNLTAWFNASCPNETYRDAERAVRLAEIVLKARKGSFSAHNTLGIAYYRAGEHDKAIELLDKSNQLAKQKRAANGFFLAMANWRIGKRAEARRLLAESVADMRANDPGSTELLLFRREAEEVLGEQ